MAITVISAFEGFLKNTVNLDADDVKSARSSRTWLIGKIHAFPLHDSSFPALYSEKDINFGSFARNTKKRPLDDIDMMICLNARGGSYNEYTDKIEITIDSSVKNLKDLCNTFTNTLNSVKVVNKFVSSLKTVPQYKNSDIKRNQEAAVLNLTSYDWSFDIVPCFFTKEDYYGKTFYLIPDGSGNWKKTDPRIDKERVSTINQKNSGNVLNVIRTMKYWNKRPTMPTMSSYLIENMLLNHYETSTGASQFVDIELPGSFLYIRDNIYSYVADPKGIQGDINTLTIDEKSKIFNRAHQDYCKSLEARALEGEGKQKESINKWREIFGSDFPTYG
jgi:hypothetical protein